MVSVQRSKGGRVRGFVGLLAAVALPAALWHELIASLVESFQLEAGYLLTAWSGFALMALGVVAIVPVVWSSGTSPASRRHPRSRNALSTWGTSLYLLGLLLVVQLASITANF